MLTRIREMRQAKKLTLQQVAERCVPPTTAQTIGRLETGMRTVSLSWINRIATALGVDPASLVSLPEQTNAPLAAILRRDGPVLPKRTQFLAPPAPSPQTIGLLVEYNQGDYRQGDELWLDRLSPDDFSQALNRDILAPRPMGEMAFGRLVSLTDDRLDIAPHRPGAPLISVQHAPWIAVLTLMIRAFDRA